jgi:signal transduction histidine kinase
LAALLALSAAVIASRRLVAPLRILTEAAARLGAGDRSSRVGPIHAPGELGQLAQTFDTMAGDLEQEDALRRALVADVAHELRTPLAVLRAQLAAVSEGISEFSSETVDSLTEEVDRLSRLVDDVGVLAAAQSARLRFERRPADLAAIAAVAAERLAPRFESRRIHLVVGLESTPVVGDAGRLEQALVNLLSNAEKYGPTSSEVRLQVHRNGSQASASVSDEGPGIAPEEQERIFERFYRGAASRASTSGSGIGLAVVSEVIAAHGGSVGVESVPGHGSTFWLTLPLAP